MRFFCGVASSLLRHTTRTTAWKGIYRNLSNAALRSAQKPELGRSPDTGSVVAKQVGQIHETVPPPPKTLVTLGLSDAVASSMATNGIQEPTRVQKLAIPRVLRRENTLIAAETGSGKTLAYLAPLVTLLKKSDPVIRRKPGRPRMIVLVPTRELVAQVLNVTKSLTRTSRLSARSVVGGGPHRRSMKKLLKQYPVDILVSTPGMLNHLREQRLVFISELEALVLDEADVLLAAKGFEEQIVPFMRAVEAKPTLDDPQNPVQHIYVAATVPGSVRAFIQKRHNVSSVDAKTSASSELSLAETNNLHVATPPDQVQTTFIRVAGGEMVKLERCVDLVKRELRQSGGKKILVFCDRENRRSELVSALQDSHTVDVVHMSRHMDRVDRWHDWNKFCSNPETRVAVCAQSFSRGIDLPDIGTVILVDVPLTGGEYLHRIGRIRGRGRAYVLVTNRDRAISEALFLAHVRCIDLSSLNISSAWRSFSSSGYSRIRRDPVVLRARRAGIASWIDEREKRQSSDLPDTQPNRTRESGFVGRLSRKFGSRSKNNSTHGMGGIARSSRTARNSAGTQTGFRLSLRTKRHYRRRMKDVNTYGDLGTLD